MSCFEIGLRLIVSAVTTHGITKMENANVVFWVVLVFLRKVNISLYEPTNAVFGELKVRLLPETITA